MASNYVDTTGEDAEEGRFHGHHSSTTTPTGAAASSPRTMRRSFSSASSGSHGGGARAPKCVCAPATHAGSFKCRLHRTSSQGHGHAHPSPPTSPAGASAAPPPAVSSTDSSRTVEAETPSDPEFQPRNRQTKKSRTEERGKRVENIAYRIIRREFICISLIVISMLLEDFCFLFLLFFLFAAWDLSLMACLPSFT